MLKLKKSPIENPVPTYSENEGMFIKKLIAKAIKLLKQLISTLSFSQEEAQTALLIQKFLKEFEIESFRQGNNVWAIAKNNDRKDPTVLLNSHHDTIKPSQDWKKDPFIPIIEGDKLFGLGSNDAGGAVVSMLATFICLNRYKKLPYRLIIAITAEEETSGINGVKSTLPLLGKIDLGIVGEPTGMQMAIVEKGLLVLDCIAHGKAGHAAMNDGQNALYKAIDDINWFKNYEFDKVSELSGKVKMTVTQINAGKQHNVIPDQCNFVVDIRINEHYKNEEVLKIIKNNIQSEITTRSYCLNSSSIFPKHPIVKKGIEMGLHCYGSPTLSNQAMMNFTTIKIGPGKSKRSHSADEFIYLSEIEEGIKVYINLLKDLRL